MEPRALRLTAAALASWAAICASPLPAQEPREEALWEVVAEDMDLADLLDACVGILDFNLVYDRSLVQGSVHLELTSGLTSEGLWVLANRALLEHDLACVQLPGAEALSVVPLEKAKSLARLEAPDLAGARAGYVKVLVPLRGPPARGLVEMVRAALSQEGGVITSLPEGGVLLLSDLRPHVEQALGISRSLAQAH